jgi:hypothetical protein
LTNKDAKERGGSDARTASGGLDELSIHQYMIGGKSKLIISVGNGGCPIVGGNELS